MTTPNLRSKVITGGASMVARQAIGTVVRMVGVFVLIGLLGPEEYARYIAPISLLLIVGSLVPLGIATSLTRRLEDPTDEEMAVLTGYMLVAGSLLAGMCWGVHLFGAARGWADTYTLPLAWLSVANLLQFLEHPAGVRLDRELRFPIRGTIEVAGDILFYVVAVGLAWQGAGFAAPVAAQILMNAVVVVGMWKAARIPPRVILDFRQLRTLAKSGIGFAGFQVSVHIFDSVVVVVAALFLTTGQTGVIGFAQRLANRAAILRVAVDNLALASLAKIQDDNERLRRIHAEATLLHLLTTGGAVAGLTFVAPFIIPAVFPEYASASIVLAYLALFQLMSVAFDMHVNVLQVVGQTRPIIMQKFLQAGVTAVALTVFIWQFGFDGFGPALLIGSVSLWMLVPPVRELFTVDTSAFMPVFVGLLPLFAAPAVPTRFRILLFIPILIVLVRPAVRSEVLRLIREVLSSVRRTPAAVAPHEV